MKRIVFTLIIMLSALLFLSSCWKKSEVLTKDEIKLAYSGSAFDLPLIIAYHNGYFEEEGLKVKLIPVEKEKLADSLQNGTVDGGTADESILINIYNGLKAKIGAGLRGGCIEIIASTASGAKELKDLAGKNIGVEEGEREQVAATLEVLKNSGMDGLTDLNWVYLKKEELIDTLKENKIDALVRLQDKDNEEIQEANILYQNSAMKDGGSGGHSHGTNNHFYDSFAVLSEDFAVNYPEEASLVLSAWVSGVNALTNGTDFQLEIAKEGGFITDKSRNDELKYYMFVPGIKTVPENLMAFVKVEQMEELLPEDIDVEDFIDNIFIKLLLDWG